MSQNNIQRRGKPSQLEVIQPNTNVWLFNVRSLQLYSLLQEGTHYFPYCSRKGESLSPEDEKTKSRVLAASEFLGIIVHPDKAIVLFFKTEQSLPDPYNHELIAQLCKKLENMQAGRLIQLCYQFDEKFIQELITIMDYNGQEGFLAERLLNTTDLRPADYNQIVKNAYLHHVKQNKNPYTFQEFLGSNDAFYQVAQFAQRINQLIYMNGQ